MQGRPSLGFLCALPSMELLNQGTLPSSFCIHCFEDIAEPEEYIWQFLEKLETASFELPPAGCELRLVWRRGPSDFSWFGGEGNKEYAAFIGQLLPIAARLYKKNIRIVDRDDADYMSLSTIGPPS
jgi:hypothetical protein